MKINIKNILFGEFETFPGDPFFWMADLGTLYIRTVLQKTITRLIFWSYNVFLVLFIVYMCRARNEKEMLINDIAFASTMFECQIMYGNSMRKFRLFNKAFAAIGNLVVKGQKKRPDESLNEEMKEFSKKLKIFTIIIHFVIIPFTYHLYIGLLTVKNQHNLALILVNIVSLNRPAVYNTFYIVFVIIVGTHSTLYTKVALLNIIYVNVQIKFALRHLLNSMEKMQQIDRQFVDISNCTDSDEYQRKVKTELLYFLKRHLKIKQVAKFITSVMRWRYLSFALTSGIAIGSNLVSAMKATGLDTFGPVCIFLIMVHSAVVVTESGEQIKIECENIHKQAQQFAWYKWNKENCELLLMLLCQTKKPIEIHCHGFATMNRVSLLSLYRMAYSTITFFRYA